MFEIVLRQARRNPLCFSCLHRNCQSSVRLILCVMCNYCYTVSRFTGNAIKVIKSNLHIIFYPFSFSAECALNKCVHCECLSMYTIIASILRSFASSSLFCSTFRPDLCQYSVLQNIKMSNGAEIRSKTWALYKQYIGTENRVRPTAECTAWISSNAQTIKMDR